MDFDDFLEDDSATLSDLNASEEEEFSPATVSTSLMNDISLLGEEDAHYAILQSSIASYSTFESFALNVAMAELLDELTNGRLTLMHVKVNAERMIIIAAGNNYVMDYMEDILGIIQQKNLLMSPFYKAVLETNKDFNLFLKEKYVQIYSDACEKLDVEKDLELIKTGFYSDNTQFRKYGLNNPPNKNDNNSTI
jgi:hypothetical protein